MAQEQIEIQAQNAKVVLNLLHESERSENLSSSSSSTLEGLSTSLEDLVGCFDQKVNHVLKDLGESTIQMAPVQIRTQDEIMSESQVWYTITGNYGNLPPLDFQKTYIRKNQIESLNLSSPRDEDDNIEDAGYDDPQHDEEDYRQAMDLHQLISHQLNLHGENPPISADEVIEEIDEIMQTCDLIHSMTTDRTNDSSADSMYSSMRSPFTSTSQNTECDYKFKHTAALNVTSEELSTLPQSKLLTLMAEMEQLIMVYNAELVSELAHRDEMIYEKECKNKFVTLLVKIQDQRRKFQGQGKKKKLLSKLEGSPSPQFMTASIPFDEENTVLDVPTLESMIKILDAISEDSQQVPNLLTDYILNVVCPSTETSVIAN
uniref:Fasciculation and elongation protein zeta-2 n=1 Tax=Panagrolaimus superbus TaxID=310955 RepID=A0A914YMC8_9BILA